MKDHSWAIQDGTRIAVQAALNNDDPIYRAASNVVHTAIIQTDLHEAVQAGIVQAAQMGLLTPENTNDEEAISELRLEISCLKRTMGSYAANSTCANNRASDNLKAFFDKKKEADDLRSVVRKLLKNGHYGNCRGYSWVANHTEPFLGPCDPLCREVRTALDGKALMPDLKASAGEIKAGKVKQTLDQNENKV